MRRTVGSITLAITLTITVAGAVLLPIGPASAAGAQRIRCGMHLSGTGYLAADLRCPNGNGVVLDAASTVDLRGHRLIGPGALAGVGSRTAITLPDDGISTIEHGRIENWGHGIASSQEPALTHLKGPRSASLPHGERSG